MGYIYKITNILNNKNYIGQTSIKNPFNRWKQHYEEAFFKNNSLYLYSAMRKYGIENFIFQIIESNIDKNKIDERERHWINFYNSFENGYNLTLGGKQSHYSILTEKQVKEIQNRIITTTDTFELISTIYKVSASLISDINNGDTWFSSDLNYPLRKTNKKNFTYQEIQDIYTRLRNGETAVSIGRIYEVSNVTISNINNGLIYKDEKEVYPIYKADNSAKHLTKTQVKNIIQELLTTKDNYSVIANRLNVGRKTVSNINLGKGYINFIQELGYTKYPIRNFYKV